MCYTKREVIDLNSNIRLLEIRVQNIKNLHEGVIKFDSYRDVMSGDFTFEKADVIGIYGQNGSSKTSLINAFTIIKNLMLGRSLSDELYNYISVGEKTAEIELTLFYSDPRIPRIYTYQVILEKDSQNQTVHINYEGLFSKKYDGSWGRKNPVFEVNYDPINVMNFLSPTSALTSLKKTSMATFPQLLVLKGQKEATNRSFIFSLEFAELISKNAEMSEFASFIRSANLYAAHYLHLYDNREISKMMTLDSITFFFNKEIVSVEDELFQIISLFTESILDVKYETALDKYVMVVNLVLAKLIPGVEIGWRNMGPALGNRGEKAIRFQFVSKKGPYEIPLRLESDGIKKIISILSSMIDAFNNPYAIIIIDEFDSGIFEYLLGIILNVFKTKGVGQLLFTSHNLRALEVIKDNIIFTTNDSKARFVTIPNVKPTNNLRNQYLRSLYLGGDDNHLYNGTDEYEIYRALKEAGDITNDGE